MAKTGAIAKLTAMAKERQYAGGGIAKLAKRLKGTQETLPVAEREANKAKFLAESKTPMRLYHGTTASEGGKGTESIRRFKPSKEGALGSGVYLTPDPKFAGSYAEQVGSSMLPVYAQLKNPLILRGSGVPDKYKDPMIEALELLGMDSAKAARMVERAYEGKGYIGKEVQTRAQAQGYDGLIEYDRDGKLAEVVSYNPNAVKSAIGNRGTYDISNPELNKAKGGEVHMKKGGEPIDPRFRTAGGDPLDQFAPPRYRSAGRRPESQQDREASANIPVAVARGLVSGTLGLPGDLESLARLPYELITGKESKTFLPTSEDIEKRLPFRGASQTPVGQMFTGAGQLAGGAYTGPLSGARAVMAVPRAIRRAGQDFMQSAGQTVSPLTVYHGSPHKFDRFDASKIGTGEGAQAYGHGLYFAESPSVGQQYARDLAGVNLSPAGQQAYAVLQANVHPSMRAKALENLPKEAIAEAKAVTGGNLYTVDLPDEKIARMLDWDKPLSEQPEVIKALKGTDYEVGMSQREAEKVADMRLRQEADEWAEMTGGDPVDYSNNVDWEKYVDQVRKESGSIDSSITGKELHRMVMRDEGYRPELFDPENYQIGTSEALRGYGIPGIRYLDASSRDAGKGTSNFVVFPGEEDALTILERKKEGGEVKMAKGGSTSDELRRLLGGGMKDGGAAFGRYTTGKKYQKAVKQAKEADVNKLPDPRTYAAVMGLLGSAPDQLGFSVMHPDYKGIQRAGERGFVGGTVLGVAPAVAPLTRGLPVGAAIKPVGGNWMTGSVEKALDPLKVRVRTPGINRHTEANAASDAAINNWIDRNLANYVKKQMATPDDPVRGLAEQGIVHIPSEQVGVNRYLAPEVRRHYGTEQLGKSEAARAWEDSADVAVSGDRIKDFFNNAREPWMANADPNTMIYSPIRASQADFGQGLGFDHIIDVLKQDLDAGRIRPEQLSKVSMEQAVRRTYEFDQEMAKKMREAQIKATEGMPVYKEYPEGYRWIELTTPKTNLPEGWQEVEINGKKWLKDDKGQYIHEQDDPRLIQSKKSLEDALKYEGDTMGHCVGGYCPDVLEGRSRIYSLRDAKGEPHVTVEVQKPNWAPRHADVQRYMGAAEEEAKQLSSGYTSRDIEDIAVRMAKENAPPRIVQIKGKQNRAPNEQYLPFVQDFVRSGNWSDVGDIRNTGLRPTSDAFNETEQAFLRSKGVELKPYINPEETARYQELFKRSSDASPEAGMKAGGAVGCGCNDEPKMAAGGAAKALRNLLKPRRTEEPSLPLDLPRAPAKTREEIRPAAQRMAEQMTGEFVRPNPKKSINPANKSRVQFEMERGLTHDIRPTPGGILLPQQVADIEKQQGMLKIGVSGDTTIADKSLYRAGPYQLDMQSPQHGGPLYALGGEGAWASNNPVAANFQRRVQELSRAHGEAPVLGQFLAMGPQGSNFALHFADANLRAIDPSKMSKRQVEMFNRLIREGSDKSGPRPSFPGIEDKDSAYLHFAFDTELRKHFNAMMQKPDYTSKLGLPDGRVILHAITEPELRNTEVLTSGLSQMRLDPSVNPADLALSVHPTYSHVIPKVPGSDIGRTKYPMAAEIEFPDVAEFVRQNYRPKDVTRVYQTATPRQIVDQQHIDEIKMYEELMKQYTGKKKGGKVGPLSAVEKV